MPPAPPGVAPSPSPPLPPVAFAVTDVSGPGLFAIAGWPGCPGEPFAPFVPTTVTSLACNAPDRSSVPHSAVAPSMVRSENYKLVKHVHENQQDEFYDLKADPGETKNLRKADGNAAELQKLEAELQKRMEEVGDPLLKDAY